ncbi:MAG TPA: M3 family oligoendopeptidase [Clostridiales bacterium]|nr:M3 family oligoendopeptidase [Clostridiales bacterium]
MVFRDIPYKRYTIEEGRSAFEKAEKTMKEATSVHSVLAAKKIFDDAAIEYATAVSLANCRFTLDTRNEFYTKEIEYYDQVSPLFEELSVKFNDLLLTTPFRKELELHINKRILQKAELSKKSFSPAVIEDCQKENALVTEYSKLMAGMTFLWQGKEIPLSALRGELENGDRDVRRECAIAIGKGLKKHEKELDDLYDRLVKIRTIIAHKLGYKSFTELGYYRMGRLDYDATMVKAFRDNVQKDLVPVVKELKERIARELDIDRITFYDDAIYSGGPVPKPLLDAKGIFQAAEEMYDDMNPEIGAFMHRMLEAEAFDVEAREGKWGGGYCTTFPKYKQPFILANFNGSCGDVDVITHEFGHALAANFVFYGGDMDLDVGGMETAECHSMSMEFLSWKYTEKFFGESANAYRKKHLLSSLSFIPYGVIVDEFQHEIYDHPDYTPEERKAVYRRLEEKYRPYMEFKDIPYIEEGTRWQYQMHIYETPFYYIDYCLAQTVALWFLVKSRENYQKALDDYLTFLKTGGQKSFEALLETAGIPSPFKEGSLKELSQKVLEIAEEL